MNWLALDSAGPICSAALWDGEQLIERTVQEPRAHANHILALVSDVLEAAGCQLTDLDRIAFGEGPGGLTGVRVAASVVQGFAIVRDTPVWAVSNLLALATRVAATVVPGTTIVVAHEAGAGAVCSQSFVVADERTPTALGAIAVDMPEDITWPGGAVSIAGSASGRLNRPAGCAWFDARPTWPLAQDLLQVMRQGGGRNVPLAQAQPVYLRHPVDGKISV